MADQTQMLRQQYSRPYAVRDIPAVYFRDWSTMREQLRFGNTIRTPNEQLELVPEAPGSGEVRSRDGSFRQLWVERENSDYRSHMKSWLLGRGLDEKIPSSYNVDHLRPKAHLPDRSTVVAVALVAGSVNSSWGGGYERTSELRANKIRGAATLLQLAKALQIRGIRRTGTSRRAARTWADVARELDSMGIRGYGCLFPHSTTALQLECELRSVTNELEGWACPGQP